MYDIATDHKALLLHCEGPYWRLYLPKKVSPTPRPMTMVMIKLSWNVLRNGLVVVFAI